MRAKEFLKEDPNNALDVHRAALDGMLTVPGMDGFYEFYRFMNLAAGHPHTDIPATGKLRDNPVSLPYTDVEHEMVGKAAKKMGKKIHYVTPTGPDELDTNNTISPVAKPKKNRYGV